ncbi:MAG: hypothetical protein STSR0009_04610 [Methanoregula sp.]
MNNEQALSEIVSVILIISLVVIIAGIFLVTILGMVVVPQKSAFIAIDITDPEIGNKGFIRICNQGGDTGCLNQTDHEDNPIGIYLDTASGSHRALPVLGLDLFRPGETLYVYNRYGTYKITSNLIDLQSSHVQSVEEGAVTVRVVDEKTKVLVAEWKRTTGGVPSVFPPLILSEDFDSGLSGWTITGDVNSYAGEPKKGTNSVQMKGGGQIKRTISTAGYKAITVSFAMGASSIEGSEKVRALWSADGSAWTVLKIIDDGDTEEDNQLHDFTYALPASASNNPNFILWFGNTGANSNDYGYIDNVIISGTPL